jgi:ribulose kinase
VWSRFKLFWKTLLRWWQGKIRNIELADTASPARSEAEEAVARVIYETQVAPDCVAATVFDGGCALLVQHDKAKELFVHKSYALAADKAIEWLKGQKLQQGKTSKMNRTQRRIFETRRRKNRK